MREYIVLHIRVWANETGHGCNYSSDLVRYPTRETAISAGFEEAESDDFRLGILDDGQLVGTAWMDKDFAPDDDEDLHEVGRQLCLPVKAPASALPTGLGRSAGRSPLPPSG